MDTLPLQGLTVVAIEQAVAAPFATSRLADAGARVIKIERVGEGDFARHYDGAVHGLASHFVWLNRGKESVALDLKSEDGRAAARALVAGADVFLQNLAPEPPTGWGSAPRRCARNGRGSWSSTCPDTAPPGRGGTARPTTC